MSTVCSSRYRHGCTPAVVFVPEGGLGGGGSPGAQSDVAGTQTAGPQHDPTMQTDPSAHPPRDPESCRWNSQGMVSAHAVGTAQKCCPLLAVKQEHAPLSWQPE